MKSMFFLDKVVAVKLSFFLSNTYILAEMKLTLEKSDAIKALVKKKKKGLKTWTRFKIIFEKGWKNSDIEN